MAKYSQTLVRMNYEHQIKRMVSKTMVIELGNIWVNSWIKLIYLQSSDIPKAIGTCLSQLSNPILKDCAVKLH